MGGLEPTHWIVIAVAAAALFGGYKKLPEMARSAGRSMRIFKTELKGMADDDDARTAAKGADDAQVAQPVQAVAPTTMTVAPAGTNAGPTAPHGATAAPVSTAAPTPTKPVAPAAAPVADPTAPSV